MVLESNLSLTLSSNNPKQYLINQDTVRCTRHSVPFTHLVEDIVAYASMNPLLS